MALNSRCKIVFRRLRSCCLCFFKSTKWKHAYFLLLPLKTRAVFAHTQTIFLPVIFYDNVELFECHYCINCSLKHFSLLHATHARYVFTSIKIVLVECFHSCNSFHLMKIFVRTIALINIHYFYNTRSPETHYKC